MNPKRRTRPLLVCDRDRECLIRSRQTVVALAAVRQELANYLAHGRPEHLGDWWHDAMRSRRGTISWAK